MEIDRSAGRVMGIVARQERPGGSEHPGDQSLRGSRVVPVVGEFRFEKAFLRDDPRDGQCRRIARTRKSSRHDPLSKTIKVGRVAVRRPRGPGRGVRLRRHRRRSRGLRSRIRLPVVAPSPLAEGVPLPATLRSRQLGQGDSSAHAFDDAPGAAVTVGALARDGNQSAVTARTPTPRPLPVRAPRRRGRARRSSTRAADLRSAPPVRRR